jgi:hypothetical protein
MNRILRIETDRWVTGRAIRWAAEEARLKVPHPTEHATFAFTRAGTDYGGDDLSDDDKPAILVTIDGWRNSEQ